LERALHRSRQRGGAPSAREKRKTGNITGGGNGEGVSPVHSCVLRSRASLAASAEECQDAELNCKFKEKVRPTTRKNHGPKKKPFGIRTPNVEELLKEAFLGRVRFGRSAIWPKESTVSTTVKDVLPPGKDLHTTSQEPGNWRKHSSLGYITPVITGEVLSLSPGNGFGRRPLCWRGSGLVYPGSLHFLEAAFGLLGRGAFTERGYVRGKSQDRAKIPNSGRREEVYDRTQKGGRKTSGGAQFR